MNEQLGSPMVYEETDDFTTRMRELIPVYFNPIKAVYHYLGITANFTHHLVTPKAKSRFV